MNRKNISGFTLIEMSIVVVISGLFIVGIMQAYSIYRAEQQSKQLTSTFDILKSAISDYVIDDPRDTTDDGLEFPCPAPIDIGPNDANYGQAYCPVVAAGSCDNGVCVVSGTAGQDVYIGAVPTKSLDLPDSYATDPYLNKITYAVSAALTAPDALTTTTTGAITILGDTGTITDTSRFAIISHGQDGAGSYTQSGAQYGKSCRVGAAGSGDSENCDSDATFRVTTGQVKADLNIYYDDHVSFSLGDNTGWWMATDDTGQDIVNRNVAGRVGVGTIAPETMMDIAGEIKIGNTSITCNSARVGALRYNAAVDAMQYCADNSGTPSWMPFPGPSSLRAESGRNVIATSCSGTNSGGLCSGFYYKDITFSTPFSSPPHVMVAPSHLSDQGGCVGNTTDLVIAKAQSVTTTGFRLRVHGSPKGPACGAFEGHASLGRANWIAVGN